MTTNKPGIVPHWADLFIKDGVSNKYNRRLLTVDEQNYGFYPFRTRVKRQPLNQILGELSEWHQYQDNVNSNQVTLEAKIGPDALFDGGAGIPINLVYRIVGEVLHISIYPRSGALYKRLITTGYLTIELLTGSWPTDITQFTGRESTIWMWSNRPNADLFGNNYLCELRNQTGSGDFNIYYTGSATGYFPADSAIQNTGVTKTTMQFM